MARRASSSTNPALIVGIVIAVGALVYGGKMLLSGKSSSFDDVQPLVVEELLENGNSLRGNEYMVEGTIDGKLRWTSDNGQVVSVRVKSSGGDDIIPILVPQKFSKLNIEREQRYAFKVEFEKGGVPVATGVSRL
ncbi:MAG: hypothetical protein NWT08_12635 [Akkermansiaceae bacterium]|jgi:hypothetical protein|nr:hypothetical protein [Akkermansiaceae bacterium]MDP4647396.1 hypothetical protein [Akkermansiaceae bacterium]MDP4722133.1 hypothetical protein [Akkermansiaceae bacterium]MDP4781541.1 hypothetical protein [Akkermansiaceae bacterium]MDP4848002.1 hypothetical protein [Akkermansiaceae bacterium]